MANSTSLKKISIVQDGGSLDTKDIGAEAQYVEISYDSQGEVIKDINNPEVSVDSIKTLPEVVIEINNGISDIETDISDIETDVSTKAAASAIGPTEEGSTASIDYLVGEHFYKNNAFCTALTNINQGQAFILDTNYKEGTISKDLKSNTNFVGTMLEWSQCQEKSKYETADII